MSKNNDLVSRLDAWTNRLKKSAETIESEEKKMQDPPAQSGGMAKEKEQDLKNQSPPAGAENLPDTVAPMRDDNTVADATPLAETQDKAETTTTEKDTAKEESKLASERLLDSVVSLIESAEAATKAAALKKKADPTSDPTHTPEEKKDEPDVPEAKPDGAAKPAEGECKEAAEKKAAEKKAAEAANVIDFLEGMWKSAGLKGEMTQEGLIKLAMERADQDGERVGRWMATVTKTAEEMGMPPAADPSEQDAMLQALMGQMGGEGDMGGDLTAMMGSPEDEAAGDLSGIPPEVLQQVIAALQGEIGGEEPSEPEAAPEGESEGGAKGEGNPEEEIE